MKILFIRLAVAIIPLIALIGVVALFETSRREGV